jgi:hypothetical protein
MFFKLNIFLIALFIGFLGVYVTPPEYHIINKTPTNFNSDIIYTNENGDCYVYKKEKVKCSDKAIDLI